VLERVITSQPAGQTGLVAEVIYQAIILPTVIPVTKFTVVEESALARLAAIGTGATRGGGSAMAMKNAKGGGDIFTTTA
jgi:hypothetical protein